MNRPLLESEFFPGLNVIHLKLFGVLPSVNFFKATGRRKPIYTILVFCSIIHALPYILCQMFSLFVVKMQKLTMTYLICTPLIQSVSKQFCFWYRIEEESTLFDLIREDFLVSTTPEEKPEAKVIYRRTAKVCNIIFLLPYLGVYPVAIIWALVPGYETEPPSGGRLKVLSGWYPFNCSLSPTYEIVRVYETTILFWHGSQFSLYSCAIFLPLMALYAHLRVLGRNMAAIGEGRTGAGTVHQQLKLVLEDYNRLIRYADLLKEVYNTLITVMLGTSTLTIILNVLQFLFEGIDSDSWFTTVRFFMYLSYEIVEISLLCFTSSFVESASSDILFAIYSCEWYLADKEFADTVRMVMVRSLRPVYLTAIKMYPVNMETLLKIAQFIYSTAAVLSKMKE